MKSFRPEFSHQPSHQLSGLNIAVHWILRLACAACFIGHGAFGIITKESWVPFFEYFGIARQIAFDVMPLIGGMDITLGLLVLLRPRKILLAYMAVWAVFTALLRPLIGMSGWEFVERAGNYGVPLALLLLGNPGWHLRYWFTGFGPQPIHQHSLKTGITILQFTTGGLLIGHGMLGVFHKPLLLYHWSFVPYLSLRWVLYASALNWSGFLKLSWGSLFLFIPWLCSSCLCVYGKSGRNSRISFQAIQSGNLSNVEGVTGRR